MRSPNEVTVYNMMATPFTDDGAVDLDGFAQLLEKMCEANIGVYLGSGGAGEGHALSLAELRELYRVGVQVAKGRIPVAANPREPRTAAQMLELATVAAEEGVPLVQLYSLDAGHGMRPYGAELERYYRFLLDRLDCPVAISVHAYYPYPVPPSLLADLCRSYPQIEAINVIMPMNYFLEVREALAPVGREIRLYTSMMTYVEGFYAGSYGVQCAEPNLIPHTIRRLTDAILTGDTETASRLYVFVYEFMRICGRWAPSTARWIKMGLNVLGLPGRNGALREPYLLPEQGQLDEMKTAFDRLRVAEMEAESAAAARK
jgi:4-hydroxy-tetrahydrodipicolinate synthase